MVACSEWLGQKLVIFFFLLLLKAEQGTFLTLSLLIVVLIATQLSWSIIQSSATALVQQVITMPGSNSRMC